MSDPLIARDPNYFAVDQGTAKNSRKVKEFFGAHFISLNNAPIETICFIGAAVKHQMTLRLANGSILIELRKTISDQKLLNLSIFTINFSVRPECSCRALFVFGAVPH